MNNNILLQVREMMDRDWSLLEIATKLRIDPEIVRIAMDIIQDLLT
jgi:hypothetical protein